MSVPELPKEIWILMLQRCCPDVETMKEVLYLKRCLRFGLKEVDVEKVLRPFVLRMAWLKTGYPNCCRDLKKKMSSPITFANAFDTCPYCFCLIRKKRRKFRKTLKNHVDHTCPLASFLNDEDVVIDDMIIDLTKIYYKCKFCPERHQPQIQKNWVNDIHRHIQQHTSFQKLSDFIINRLLVFHN